MQYIATHIFKEGNQVANSLANFGLSLSSLVFGTNIPFFVKELLVKNKIGLPNYKFSYF